MGSGAGRDERGFPWKGRRGIQEGRGENVARNRKVYKPGFWEGFYKGDHPNLKEWLPGRKGERNTFG